MARKKRITKNGLNQDDYFHIHDPRQLYVNRAYRNSRKANTYAEKLLVNVLGPELIGSIHFAIDPLSRFQVDPRLVSDKVRIRKRSSRKHTRSWSIASHQVRFERSLFYPNIPDSTSTSDSASNGTLSPNEVIGGNCEDTTASTRFKWEKGGTAEIFQPTFTFSSSPPAYSFYINSYGFGKSQSRVDTTVRHDSVGPFAYLAKSYQETLQSIEENIADTAIANNLNRLLAHSLPTSPSFGLLRSIAELKDLPSLKELIKLPFELQERLLRFKDLGDVTLSYEFGIKPLLADAMRLLELPDIVAKRLNFLQSRNGKPTTYRQRVILNEPFVGTPPWVQGDMLKDGFKIDTDKSGSSSTRTAEVRSSLTSTFEFPSVALPEFRRRLATRLLGANPNITALYELMPWTWLFDWFTGLGDYVEVIDNINQDPSLINDGWIVYNSSVELSNWTQTHKTVTSTFRKSGVTTSYPKQVFGHYSSNFAYEYYKRVRMGDAGVPSANQLKNLSDYQLKILSALALQRG